MTSSVTRYQQYRQAVKDELVERVRIHQQKLATLKAAKTARMTLGSPLPPDPLVLLAQGDSWFDYPADGNTPTAGLYDTDIIAHLRHSGDPAPQILNVAHWGETATTELSYKKQAQMVQALGDSANWMDKGRPDAILFSGGGNDIAGDQFCVFLDYNNRGLDEDRFREALGMVEACYRDLFLFRDQFAPKVPIFGHCYDFPIPSGVEICTEGPWLWPSLHFCGYSQAQGREILKKVMTDFKALLDRLAAEKNPDGSSKNNFIVVQTQNTLHPPGDWANELHPVSSGFQNLAAKFVEALRQQFPGRI